MRLQPTPREYQAQGLEAVDRRLRRLERRPAERVTWHEYTPLLTFTGGVIDPMDSYLRGWWADTGGIMLLHGIFIAGAAWGDEWVGIFEGLPPDNEGGGDIYATGGSLSFGMPEVGYRLIDTTGYGAYWWGDGYLRPTEQVWQYGPALIVGPGGRSLPAVALLDDNQLALYEPHHRTRRIEIGVQAAVQEEFFGGSVTAGHVGRYWPIRWWHYDTGEWRVMWSMMVATVPYDHTAPENPYEILTPWS